MFDEDALTVATGTTVRRNWNLQDLLDKKSESEKQASFASKLAKQSKIDAVALKS